MKLTAIIIIALALAGAGCINSSFTMPVSAGLTISLYNRGGVVASDAATGSTNAAGHAAMTEGGGALRVDPSVPADAVK